MYIQNRRDSSKFKGCSPLHLHLGLIGLKPAIAYFAYTKRCASCRDNSYFENKTYLMEMT